MPSECKQTLEAVVRSVWICAVVAYAGMLTCTSSCTLPVLPGCAVCSCQSCCICQTMHWKRCPFIRALLCSAAALQLMSVAVMAQASLAQQEAALHVLLNGTVSEVTQHMATFQTDSARSDFMQAKLHLMCVTLLPGCKARARCNCLSSC